MVDELFTVTVLVEPDPLFEIVIEVDANALGVKISKTRNTMQAVADLAFITTYLYNLYIVLSTNNNPLNYMNFIYKIDLC